MSQSTNNESSMILWINKSKNIIIIYDGTNSGNITVIDNLTSTDTTTALSANQGRLLNELIGDIGTVLDSINRKVV